MNFLAPRPQYPSVKFPNVGDTFDGTIAAPVEYRQNIKFGTKVPDTWPNGDPKMQAKVICDTPEGAYALYVVEGTQLAYAIRDGVKEAGAEAMTQGGRLWVKRIEDGEAKPGLQAPHGFEAKYQPPAQEEGPPF